MSTRSRIGIELKDGSVLSVYHHWDGYPEWLGVKLEQLFYNRDLVTELIDGGDMSSCYESDDHPVPMYYSQRGENCPPYLDESIDEYLKDGEEFAYLYTRKNVWKCWDRHEFDDQSPELVAIPL
jgi:hypothetical protein